MKYSSVLFTFTLGFICLLANCNRIDKTPYRQIADFEPMDAIWMSCINNFNYMSIESDMVDKLERNIQVRIAMVDGQEEHNCKEFFGSSNFNFDMIEFFTLKGNDYWIRDHGPIFVYDVNKNLCVVDFKWNQYGYRSFLMDYYRGNISLVNEKLSELRIEAKAKFDSIFAVKFKLPIVKSWLVTEGGAMEANGKGTLILNKNLMIQRNPDSSLQAMEKELNRVLGAKNIIWLNQGLAENVHIVGTITENFVGIGTGGHTDEFVRFANPKTILLASVNPEDKISNPVSAINYERMEENFKILQAARDLDGSKFEIVRIPLPKLIAVKIRINPGNQVDSTLNMPETVFNPSDGWQAHDSVWRVACASYLNYYLSNNKVFFPSYTNFGTPMSHEFQVISLFKKAFPNREIIPINSRGLNWFGGGLHCATLNEFKSKEIITP